MRKFLVLALMFVLMFGLVVGAGYNVVVPSVTPPATTTGGGGSAGITTVDNDSTDSDEVVGAVDDDSDSAESSPVSVGANKIADFVKGISWELVVIILAVLGVIGGTSWYILKDKRKGFVEVRVKGKK